MYRTHQAGWLLLALASLSAADEASDAQCLLQARTTEVHREPAPAEVHREPAPAERSCESSADAGWAKNWRVLLFWAVSSSPNVMDLVMQNVNHARSFPSLHVDVYLNHYDQNKDPWLKKSAAWYKDNVDFSASVQGIKFWVARTLLANMSVAAYEWLWFLDEDADFRASNLTRMILDARASNALIVTPSIVFEPLRPRNKFDKAVLRHRRGWMDKEGTQPTYACQELEPQCVLQAPHEECMYRHVGFVEVSFPLLRPQAFISTAGTCDACLHKESVWGLDHVWCALSAQGACSDRRTACAVLDRVNITHRNFKTLPKWRANLTPEELHANIKAQGDVFRQYPGTNSGVTQYDCTHA